MTSSELYHTIHALQWWMWAFFALILMVSVYIWVDTWKTTWPDSYNRFIYWMRGLL
jgi:hypothetical protein|tara:strand:- start:3489 stop:3656 length:168 start_codon:yes stop_codon:yes gene_type:complete